MVRIVAEIGVNHDGRIDGARELIAAAAAAGADAVKFQYFVPERLLSAQAEVAAYQRAAGHAGSLRDLLRPLALAVDAVGELVDAAHAAGLAAWVTPFSPADCVDLAPLPLDAVKIAAPDAVNPPLISAAASLDKPLVISTGACTLDELHVARDAAGRSGGALLHCVSAYPTPIAQAALGGIAALADWVGVDGVGADGGAIPVGYSDHTAAVETGGFAVACGATLLEKHLTLDRRAAGPDHAASLEPDAFAKYVRFARASHRLPYAGARTKTVGPLEADVRRVSRQSVAAAHDLIAGIRLRPADLTVMRPGTGIPAARLTRLIGKRLGVDVSAGHLLPPDSVADA